ILILILFFGIINNSIAQTANGPSNPSTNYLDSLFAPKGEIYFKFNVNSSQELETITNTVSIDNFKNNVVWAYANRNEFSNFLQLNYPYILLPHPGFNPNPNMRSAVNIKQTNAWDFFPTYTAYETMMAQYQSSYPNLCKIVCIKTLTSGRKLLVAKLTNNVNTAANKPRFLYSSSIHGDETTGFALMLQLMDYLLSNYGTNTRLTNILNNVELWICPDANPDGTYKGGNASVSGAVRNNNNNVDLNRNYADPRAGQHPDGNVWQPETQAFMNFADTMYFNMSANFHGGASVANFPWDTWTSTRMNADDSWWRLISNQYVDSAKAFGPANYFTDVISTGVTEGGDWYVITGGRQDYMNYFKHCKEETFEISLTKNMPGTSLPTYWNANYRSFINYIEQSLKGVRGLITDQCSGIPLKAKVFITGHDLDSSHVYSRLSIGDYHRSLIAGTYNLTFSASGYQSQTINNVSVTNGNTTTLNVQMVPISSVKPVPNFTANNTTSCSGIVNFTDNTTMNPGTWLWNFGDGTTSTLKNPSHTYLASGTYSVKLKASNCIGIDSITKTSYITVSLAAAPTVVNGSRCGTGIVNLSATGAGTLNWYDAVSGGNLVGTGSNLTTPSIVNTTTYYVQDVTPVKKYVGKADNTGTGSYYTTATYAYLVFNCLAPCKLVSVQVYATGDGYRTIELRNSGGTVLQSATVFVPNGSSRVTLNFDLTVATGLQLGTYGGTLNNLFRNTASVVFPYTQAGLVSITANSTAGAYSFFYNWELQEPVCMSPRTPVIATVNQTPVPAITPVGSTNICSGSTVILNANTGSGINYQWLNNGSIIAGATTSTYSTSTSGNYSVIESISTCADTSTIQTVTVSPTTVAGTVNGGASICSGNTSGLLTLTGNTGSIVKWQYSVSPFTVWNDITNTSTTYTSGILSQTTQFRAVVQSGSCLSENSAATTVTVNPASVGGAVNGSTSVCSGNNSGLLTLTGNTGNIVKWQYSVSPFTVWTDITNTSTSYTSGNLTQTTQFRAVIQSGSCAVSNSSAAIITVNSALPASVAISASPSNTICGGSNVTFTAAPVNGGSPGYQWYLNGTIIPGATNSTYSSTGLINGDIISCNMNSSLGCVTGSPANSNQIAMTVNAPVAASVGINASSTTICQGSNVTFTAAPVNGGTPSYQWYLNGTQIPGATNPTYSSSGLSNNDAISCIMTSNHSCVTGSPANSNVVNMTVNPTGTASISISANPSNAVCSGTNVTFIASPVNGGTPSYQWYNNGSIIVGATNSTYSSASLLNNDIISCTLISNATCVSTNPVSSNQITMNISSSVLPTITINPSDSEICEGTSVTFNTTCQYGGVSPTYTWSLNGTTVGTNSSTYSPIAIANGDVISCILTSSESCASIATANSNNITMIIHPTPATPTITQNMNTLVSSSVTGNQWYFAQLGSPIGGATNQNYFPITTGYYYTIITDAFGCVSDTSNQIYVLITEIKEISNSDFSVIPNPSHGKFIINMNANWNESFELQLFNSIGEKVGKPIMINHKTKEIDYSGISEGIYFIRISNEKTTSSQKLMILK
ncbi:MAG: PKD domain-containing protein, partial [Bacteroidetes bacterium]|nr:PKD domain-containing protein [Bacteroidota bacterium]